jgi:hypothetical protein
VLDSMGTFDVRIIIKTVGGAAAATASASSYGGALAAYLLDVELSRPFQLAFPCHVY